MGSHFSMARDRQTAESDGRQRIGYLCKTGEAKLYYVTKATDIAGSENHLSEHSESIYASGLTLTSCEGQTG
jgi:hypothetical protein